MKTGSTDIDDFRVGTDAVSKIYQGTNEVWSSAPALSITGGTYTEAGGYAYHTFTTSGTLSVTGSIDIEYLVVAGGGPGGRGSASGIGSGGSGGGAGGYLSGTTTLADTDYTIVIGAGGPAPSISADAATNNGGNSTAFGLTAIGGGHGSRKSSYAPANGGSGGGGTPGTYYTGGAGTSGQGYAGGTASSDSGDILAAGGGGAGQAGKNPTAFVPGNGGNGLQWSDGNYYAGGGAGGTWCQEATASGGLGGGGDSYNTGAEGEAGAANTGGGGGGGYYCSGTYKNGGNGGSGIVIVRYAL